MNWQMIVGALFIIAGITQLFEDFGNALFTMALGAGLLYWGLRRRNKDKKTKTTFPKERVLSEETFHAAGVSYYENNIRKLACNNPDWQMSSSQILSSGRAGKRIFKHNFINKPVKLQEEPNNPHDKNAVAVIIAGELVGYLSREDNLHVKEILNKREIKSLSGFIGGGEYKVVDESGAVTKDNLGFSVNVRIKYI